MWSCLGSKMPPLVPPRQEGSPTKLTGAKLRTLTTPGKHFDGAGLYLELTPAGGRYWRMKYRHGGKEKRLVFGVYPEVTLKAARDKATNARKVMQAGIDPGALRKSEKAGAAFDAVNTLEAVARAWLEHQSGRWEPITLHRITASLETYIFKPLGDRPVASVKPGEIMEAVKRIEKAGASDQAGRVLQRVKSLYRWGMTHERIDANPMVDLVARKSGNSASDMAGLWVTSRGLQHTHDIDPVIKRNVEKTYRPNGKLRTPGTSSSRARPIIGCVASIWNCSSS